LEGTLRKIHLLALLTVLALACGTSVTATATPVIDMDSIVAQTFAAYTIEAALTLAAAPPAASSPLPPPSATPEGATPTSPPPPPPSATPEEIAPAPLPATHTGIILNNGECFNFDNGQVTAPDAQCDVWLAEPALFRQMNSAQISGYVTLTPPSRSQCATGRFEPGDLGVQTDMYMCFITNQGGIGFIVVRQYLGTVPSTGIVFDYWVFR
jgi:hypothetical protein